MTRKVSAVEAKRKFDELVDRVQCRGDRILIHRRGKPAAAIVSVRDLRSLPERREERPDLDKPGAILDCVGLFADFPEWEQIMKDVVASRGRSMPRKVKIG